MGESRLRLLELMNGADRASLLVVPSTTRRRFPMLTFSPLLPMETVTPAKTSGDPSKTPKGRTFEVGCLGYVTAGSIEAEITRRTSVPLFLSIAASRSAAEAFHANFYGARGRVEVLGLGGIERKQLQMPRKKALRFSRRSIEGGLLYAYWHPTLELEPDSLESDERKIEVVQMERRAWAEAQDLPQLEGISREDRARSALFAALLTRRTRLPIPLDPHFQVRLFRSALRERWTTDGSTDVGTTKVGLPEFLPPIVVSVPEKTFGEHLREEIRAHYSSGES